MEILSILATESRPTRSDNERGHRVCVFLAAASSIALTLVLAIYGFDYYVLNEADRPFSPKHELLKPSGAIGIKLGILGVALFLTIFLYALRKKIPWLMSLGRSKHWLDFHVVAGLTAPVVIAFHASFKFHGIAGMAFWIMTAVALSGVVGRYFYSQIPRSLNATEASWRELADLEERLTIELSFQSVFSSKQLEKLLRMPTRDETREMSLSRAVLAMLAIDCARPVRVAILRLSTLDWSGRLVTCGGLLRTGNQELERVIGIARQKSSLSKRTAFLSRTQEVFYLWHVIHRPFSYSFAVLAILHIAVVTGLGFR